MPKSKECIVTTEECDIAEAYQVENYRRNANHQMAQIIPHPSLSESRYRLAKDKGLVKKASKAHQQVWDRLESYLMEIGVDSYYQITPNQALVGLIQMLGADFRGATSPETLSSNPHRMISVAKDLNKLIDVAAEIELEDPHTWTNRIKRAWMPIAFTRMKKERFGILAKFAEVAGSFVEATRTLGAKSLTRIGDAKDDFDRYFNHIMTNKDVTEDMVMDGMIVMTNNEMYPQVMFHGTLERNGKKVHKIDIAGKEYYAPAKEISTENIMEALKKKYRDELVDEIMSGDVRHITFSDNPSKSDMFQIRKVLKFAKEKKKLAEKGKMEKEAEGRMHTYEVGKYRYTIVMTKGERKGERQDRWNAFIVSHTDLSIPEGKRKPVHYFTSKGKIKESKMVKKYKIQSAVELFGDKNGYHKSKKWRNYGPILSRNMQPIEFSIDKQPIFNEGSLMENQPSPIMMGDGVGLPGSNIWSYIAEIRQTLNSFADNTIIPMKEKNQRRIRIAVRTLENNPKMAELLGYDPKKEGEMMDQILSHFDIKNFLYKTKDGDQLYTRNSFFNKKKGNYYPWMWTDSAVLDMTSKAIEEIETRLNNVDEPTDEQIENATEQIDSMKSIMELMLNKAARYDPKSKLALGAQTAMTKHRKLWTDPTMRRKDSEVLKDYLNQTIHGLQSEAIHASALESLVQLAMTAKGKDKVLFDAQTGWINNRLKLTLSDPTADAFMPLIGRKDMHYDSVKFSNWLNGLMEKVGSKRRWDAKSAQNLILTQRAMTSAGLLGMFGAIINRTQTLNTFISIGHKHWSEAWKIMNSDFKHRTDDELSGMDWKEVVDITGVDQLISAFADAVAPVSEVEMSDRGYQIWSQNLPLGQFLPAKAMRRFIKMKWWSESGADSFIQNGDPEWDAYLKNLEERRIKDYRLMKSNLNTSKLKGKDAKRAVALMKLIDKEYGSENNYLRKRNLNELRGVIVDLMSTPKDSNTREIVEAKYKILMGQISQERLEKMVAYKLSFWKEGLGDRAWLTFTEGERQMRQHGAISHLLHAYRNGTLGRKGKQIKFKYTKMVNGKEEIREGWTWECFTTDEAIRIARAAVRNEYFGMTKNHMGEAFAGLGDSIWQYKGYPLQQALHDFRVMKHFSGLPSASYRLTKEMGQIWYEKSKGIPYDPTNPDVDEDARAAIRLIATRGAMSAIGAVMETTSLLGRTFIGSNYNIFKNIMSGAENPLLKIIVRVFINGLVMASMGDDDRAKRGLGRSFLDVIRLFLPLWITFIPLQFYYAQQRFR